MLEGILTFFVLAGSLPLLAGCYQFVLAGLHRFRHREGPLLDGETFFLRQPQHGTARHAGQDMVAERLGAD